jgi:hypothetical protein
VQTFLAGSPLVQVHALEDAWSRSLWHKGHGVGGGCDAELPNPENASGHRSARSTSRSLLARWSSVTASTRSPHPCIERGSQGPSEAHWGLTRAVAGRCPFRARPNDQGVRAPASENHDPETQFVNPDRERANPETQFANPDRERANPDTQFANPATRSGCAHDLDGWSGDWRPRPGVRY